MTGPGTGIYVLAGANGAGKSSVLGGMLEHHGKPHFNPDAAALLIQRRFPSVDGDEANSLAWNQMVRLLRRAIAERIFFSFETTLGGRTIPDLLEGACAAGIDVRMWFVSLSDPDTNVERVRRRHERGGHTVPEDWIRARYVNGQANLIRLLPLLTELWVYDNSIEGDPGLGMAPEPQLILKTQSGTPEICDLTAVPPWARAVVVAAHS